MARDPPKRTALASFVDPDFNQMVSFETTADRVTLARHMGLGLPKMADLEHLQRVSG